MVPLHVTKKAIHYISIIQVVTKYFATKGNISKTTLFEFHYKRDCAMDVTINGPPNAVTKDGTVCPLQANWNSVLFK